MGSPARAARCSMWTTTAGARGRSVLDSKRRGLPIHSARACRAVRGCASAALRSDHVRGECCRRNTERHITLVPSSSRPMRPELRCACVPDWRFCGSYDCDRDGVRRDGWSSSSVRCWRPRWCSSPRRRRARARRAGRARRRSGADRLLLRRRHHLRRRARPRRHRDDRGRRLRSRDRHRRRGQVAPVRAREGRRTPSPSTRRPSPRA